MTQLLRVLAFGSCLLAACANSALVFEEAVERGNTVKVEALLAKGANVNAKNADGRTPLHQAASAGNKDMAALLLAKGAEVNAKEGDVNDKIGNGGITPLHLAVLIKRKDVVELLLTKGADVNAKNKDGRTPLHMAAEKGNKSIAESLLAKGADVNAKDMLGETPRDLAERHGEKAVVELLNEQFRLQDEQRVEKARLLKEHRLEQEREQTKLLEGRITSNPRAGFLELIARLKSNPFDDTIRRRIIQLAEELKPPPAIPEEARKHFLEGAAIVKAAKTPAQQTLAAQSFTEAINVAPWWGDAYYNLGVAQELAEQYDKAQQAFAFYLLSNLDETERREVQDHLYGLSAKRKLSGAK